MSWESAWKYLEKAGGAGSGDRNNTLNRLSFAILERFPDLGQTEFYGLMHKWGCTCSPPIEESEILKTAGSAWAGAHRKGAVGSKQRTGGAHRPAQAFTPRIVSSTPPAAAAQEMKPVVRSYDLDATFTSLPASMTDGARAMLKAAFKPGEKVRIVPAMLGDDGGEAPDGQGHVFSLEEWLKRLDGCDGNPNGIFSSSKKTGIYIGINPGGTKDADITSHRHALVEFDEGLTLEQQWLLYQQSRLPITAVIYSGGKSVHAWVRVDASDRKEYESRVKFLYDHFEGSGLNLDKHNRNPARLSRLPNCVRFSKRQELLALNIGCETWADWVDELQAGELGTPLTIDDLDQFDPKEDPDVLIGDRWLCRGGSVMFVGPSGVGKSSLTMQMVISWAIGRPVFGVEPVRPLKVLVIQAENDLGDLSEQAIGVRQGLGLDPAQNPEEYGLLRKNLLFFRDTTHTGFGFVDSVHRLIRKHRPDLVVADPLLSFVGGDISRQEVCGQFLRNWLGPISQSTGVAWAFIHHTGKPPGDKDARKGWQTSDWSYAGIGSSELTNWARAVVTLRQADHQNFTLGFTKRGKRAGACHPSGEPATTVWIRHSATGIYWEQSDPPEEPAEDENRPRKAIGKPSKIQEIASMNLNDFLAGCVAEGEGKKAVARRLEGWLAKRSLDVSFDTCKRSIEAIVASGKLTKTEDGKYRKGPNA